MRQFSGSLLVIGLAGLTLLILVLVGQGGWPGAVSGCVAAGECSCEAIRSGLVVQPANTITSLSFVLVAAAIPWLGPAADDRAVLARMQSESSRPPFS